MRVICIVILLFYCPLLWAQPAKEDSVVQKGIELYQKGEYEASVAILQGRLKIAIDRNEKNIQKVIYNNLGNNYADMGRSVDALKAYEKAISIADEQHDKKSVAKLTKNIGALYSETKDFEKALAKYNEAEKIGISINDTFLLADCANNKGVVFEQRLQYPEALASYRKALSLYQELNMQDRIAILYTNLGVVHKYLKNYDSSIACYEQSQVISEKTGSKFMVAANLINIGNVYEMKGDYKKAVDLNEKGLQIGKEINSQELVMEAYENLAGDYAKAGDYKGAYDLYKTYMTTKDSFISVERSKQLADMQTKYETVKKEEQIIKLEKGRVQMLALIGIMVLLIIVAWLLYNRQQVKQRLAREKAVLTAEYNERLRIAKDVHDDLGSGLSKISMMADIAQKKSANNMKLGNDIQYITTISKELAENLNSMVLAYKPGETILDHSTTQLTDISKGLSNILLTAQIAKQEAISNVAMGNDIRSIAAMTKELIDNMRDLIWVLNPENTTLDNLVARLREYCADYLDGLEVNVILDFPANIPAMRISRESQRNIFSTVKEAINNCVKHAGANEIQIILKLDSDKFSITVQDNGKGFEMNNLKGSGNGLRNMKQRIETVGGIFSILSAAIAGTTINISIPFEKLKLEA